MSSGLCSAHYNGNLRCPHRLTTRHFPYSSHRQQHDACSSKDSTRPALLSEPFCRLRDSLSRTTHFPTPRAPTISIITRIHRTPFRHCLCQCSCPGIFCSRPRHQEAEVSSKLECRLNRSLEWSETAYHASALGQRRRPRQRRWYCC